MILTTASALSMISTNANGSAANPGASIMSMPAMYPRSTASRSVISCLVNPAGATPGSYMRLSSPRSARIYVVAACRRILTQDFLTAIRCSGFFQATRSNSERTDLE